MFNISENAKYLITTFGQDIKIIDPLGKIVKTKAFIQPLRSDYQSPLYSDYFDSDRTPQFLYIGLPKNRIGSYLSGTVIKTDDKIYKIITSEYIYLSEEILYERAVLEEN